MIENDARLTRTFIMKIEKRIVKLKLYRTRQRIGELVVAVGSDNDALLPHRVLGFSRFDLNFIHFWNIKGIGHGIKMLQLYLNHINHLCVARLWFDSEYSIHWMIQWSTYEEAVLARAQPPSRWRFVVLMMASNIEPTRARGPEVRRSVCQFKFRHKQQGRNSKQQYIL